MQIGEETLFRVKNQTGLTINKGTVVAFGGALANSGVLLIQLAQSSMNPRDIMGVVTDNILNGEDGYVTHFGKIRPIDATGGPEIWQEGDLLWLSPTPGKLTNIKPTASNTKISIAAVINNTSNGLIFVRPTFSGKIDDIDNVDISGITTGDILQWNTDKFTTFTPNYLTSLAHNHGIANSGGTQQFTFGVNDNIRFAGSGSASVAFTSATKTITISSTDTNTTYTNGSGLLLTGTQFSVNPTIAGNGLTFSSGVINVLVNSDSLEIVNDTIRLKDTITGNRTFSNNVIIGGDLTVNGTTTTVNTQEVDVFDNIITLAKNNTGSWVDAGIKIDRGASTHARLTWNETSDLWTAGLSGSQVPILLNVGTGLTTNGATVSLTGQALALHNLSTNGIIARTGTGTVAARTITPSTGISITNGNGVSGNPTITNTTRTAFTAITV